MAKSETGSFWRELLATNLYKRNQGRLARQLTAGALILLVVAGAFTMSQGMLAVAERSVRIGLPVLISVVGSWVIFRLVNYPPFAEFLISVQGEMNKVSWASWDELVRATIVVLSTMFVMGVVLFAYDSFWAKILSLIGVLQIEAG